MDYNDNDYEGQNLHLTGEESSKVSVLRPFALPKFDFDDSLHGHLRFDSLVENEVFLGIPSQEDNHWIEDFSRGGSGIEFSSSAAESCALPRHINVWSEATSTESVEMLLKSVGQEDMVPVENIVEESDPGDQPGNTTGQMENSLTENFKVDDAGNLLVSPAAVAGNFSEVNQSAAKDVRSEYSLQAQETSSSGPDVNNKYGLAVLGEKIENTESASPNIDVSVREPVNHDNISHISFISSSCKEKGISDPGDLEERCKDNDPELIGITSETDNIEKDFIHEFPSGLHSPKDHVVDTSIKISGEESSIAEMGKSISTGDGHNKIAFVPEPADCIQHSTVSGIESKQLSESPSILHEKPLQGESGEEIGIKQIDVVTSPLYFDSATKQVGVILSADEHKSCVGNDNISLEASCATSESSLLPEVLHNPSEKGGDYNTNQAEDVPGYSAGPTVSVECCSVKSLTEDMKDARYTAAIPKENIVDDDHVTPPSVAGSMKICTEHIVPMQVDAPDSYHDVVAHGEVGEELSQDMHKMENDDIEKEASSVCPAEGDTVEKTVGLQSDVSTVEYPVLNTDVEDTKLAASRVEGDGLVDSHEHNPPPCDLMDGDQSEENEVEANPSVPKMAFESIVHAPAIEPEKGTVPGSAAGEMNTISESVSLSETSSVTMPNEASKELNKKIANSADVPIVQEVGVESAPTKKPMESETERNIGTNFSAMSVSVCSSEIGKSNKEPIPDDSCTDLSQGQADKQVPLKSNNGENIAEVLAASEISGFNSDPSKEEGTFTFDIRHLRSQPTEDSGKDLQSFPTLQTCRLSLTGEGFPLVSSTGQMEQMAVKETSHVNSSTPGVCPPSGSLRSPLERKSRRGSGSKSGKGNSKKGNTVKENFPLKQAEKGDQSPPLLSSSGTGQLVPFESGVKPRGAVSIPTSSLPDLNTSAPSSVFFQQPFTDLQQVQLRAQIFVYGSLIQGAAPDEACMVSAFDGGRSVWERSWRACVDKLNGQKSQGNNTGTPVPSRSGAKAPDQINKQGFPQSEVLSSPAGRASNKAITSPVINPLIPLSSPLWNISTPAGETLPPNSMARGGVIDYQAVSPLNPYQTPPMRNYVAHSTWLSQAQAPPVPFPLPWFSSSQTSPFEISTSYPTFANTELVKRTSVKELSMPITSGAKHVPAIPAGHTGSSTILPVASPLDSQKVKVSTGQTADTKSRKRKKSSVAEDVGPISVTSLSEAVSAHAVPNELSNRTPAVENLSKISLIAQNQVGSMSSPVAGSYFSTSVAVTTPSCFLPKGNSNQAFSLVLPSFSSGDLIKGDLSTDKRATKSDGLSEVEEAKLQAQQAAAHAAAAISQCEGVWSQLYQQKNSGLTSDNESKLASAAVAIAAAASVAKAAAAAAKIASNAAMQAKKMADEAVTISGTLSTTVYDSNLVYSSRNLAIASPASILPSGDRNNAPSSAISAAREASRKRIEAASAATRHAENLDTIVKAAELAAEAVAQAGKVVAMGDPFSLSALAEAGPNNYWKIPQVASLPGSTSDDMNKNKSTYAGEVPNIYNQHEGPDKDLRVTNAVNPIESELSRNAGDRVTLEENLTTYVKHGDDSSKPYNDINVLDTAKTAFVSDTQTESRSPFLATSIKEGSHVEVLKDHDDLKKAWFSASVLSLKNGEALVCYNGLQSDEGSEQLKEWVSLEGKDGNLPKIRIPHPMTTVLFEGTRKRRRAAVKDYTWSIGDRVDAWVRDCWCEGIVADKNKKDMTALSIHLPAHGATLNVKMWHLRPSLVWSDGEWIEWSKPRQDGNSQGDSPAEKRPKLGSTSTEVKGKAKMAKSIDIVEMERTEEPKLPLSANEKVFNIGSTREENKPNMGRTIRSGLEKERPRVIFGVPKPGKKRKFMEVSKHYVSDRTAKTNVPSDSVKLAKFIVPQGSGSRGFRNSSNLDFKEKQVADSKPRTLKSGKPPSIPSRTFSRKDNSTSSRSSARDAAVLEHSAKGSISNDENESSEKNLADTGETSVSTMVFSSQVLPRKKAARNTRSERLNQGKLAPAHGKLAKDEAAEKLIPEVAEPRRSNRRIQPTSRLLEGLQSSLIISKIPSSLSSQDKSHRNANNKNSARGNNRG